MGTRNFSMERGHVQTSQFIFFVGVGGVSFFGSDYLFTEMNIVDKQLMLLMYYS